MLPEGRKKLKILRLWQITQQTISSHRQRTKKTLLRLSSSLKRISVDSNIARHGQCVESEFYSKWECPQKEMDELIALLEVPKRIYIRIHSYELANEYVSFRTFSNGVWNIK